MKALAATIASLTLFASSLAHAGQTTPSSTSVTLDDVRAVSPALERFAQGTIQGDLWKRPGLSPRDSSVVTVAALVARNQAAEMPRHVGLALDNGVKPGELSELITHLAFYSGWGNAMTAVAVTKDVFAQRRIAADQLPPATRPRRFPSTRPSRRGAQWAWRRISARWRQAWCNTRPTCCSATSGCARTWRRATAAL